MIAPFTPATSNTPATPATRAKVLGSAGLWAGATGQSQAWIAARIPHQGGMCLLARVVSASPSEIRCAADSHRSPDNPLRLKGSLGAACGIEYAAQAMALHGALMAEQRGQERPSMGFLISVRGVSMHVDRLDEVTDDLTVSAVCEADTGDHCMYGFSLTAGHQVLLEGRAMVMLDASLMAPEA